MTQDYIWPVTDKEYQDLVKRVGEMERKLEILVKHFEQMSNVINKVGVMVRDALEITNPEIFGKDLPEA